MKHNMIKHIYETPDALETSLAQALRPVDSVCARLRQRPLEMIILTGCGASYHDAVSARSSFESLLNVPVLAWPASEMALYPHEFFARDRLVIAISRSGEKADVMSAVRSAHAAGAAVLALTATEDGLLAREADEVVLTREGPEYCQPKTKSFVAVLGVLNLIAVHLATSAATRSAFLGKLQRMPALLRSLIPAADRDAEALARGCSDCRNMFLTGTLGNFGAALEGALKLKETSFVHAEAFPAGEAAQGPLLLLNQSWAYLALTSRDGRGLDARLLQAARSKAAYTVAVAEDAGDLAGYVHHVIPIPELPCPLFAPMAYIVPVQLLAYHLAVIGGLNADDPEGFDQILELILEPGRKEPEMR